MEKAKEWEWNFVKKKKTHKTGGGFRITSIFLTNFPPSIGADQLRRLGEQYGRVFDVFIAARLAELGKIFPSSSF